MIRKIARSEYVPSLKPGQFSWRMAIEPFNGGSCTHFYVPDVHFFNLGDARIDCLIAHSRIENQGVETIRSAYCCGYDRDGKYAISQHSTRDRLNVFTFKKPHLQPMGFFFAWFKDSDILKLEILAKYDPDGESDMIHHTWKQLYERSK